MKFGFVDEHRNIWPVRVMCAALGLSASGYYAWRSRPESERACRNRALLEEIRRVHAESSRTYGSPRVHAALRHRGRRVGRCRIERLMRHAGLRGLAALPRRTRTTDSRHNYPIAPNRLARNFVAARAGQVWLADLTYIPTGEGWLYLANVLDLGSRRLLGYSMADHMRTELALDALGWPSPPATASSSASAHTRIADRSTRRTTTSTTARPTNSGMKRADLNPLAFSLCCRVVLCHQHQA